MKRLTSLFLTFAMLVTLCACGGDTSSAQSGGWEEQYELGMKYLSEGNYQEAIIAFTAAIEIDPKQPALYAGRAQAYVLSGETEENLYAARADSEQAIELDETLAEGWLGLADVYIRMGDYDKALEVLREGLEKTGGDQSIADKIAEMEGGNITDSSGKMRRMSTYNAAGDLIWYHTYTYNEQGRIASITSFDGAGNQTGHVDYKYDGSGNVTTGCSYSDTGEVSQVDYEYDSSGNMVKYVYYDQNGQVESTASITYDADGNQIREDWQSSDGHSWYRISEYDSRGNNIKDSDYDSRGLIGYYTMTYDEEGNRTTYNGYDGEGQLEWRTVYIYDEEGNCIGDEEYDGEGNLISSTVYE